MDASFFPGSDLNEPKPPSSEELDRLNLVIRVVMGEEVAPQSWEKEEVRDALASAKLWFERWQRRASNCKIEVQAVSEARASGPGRNVRLYATWTERSTGAAGSRIIYPSVHGGETYLISSVRQLIEHATQN